MNGITFPKNPATSNPRAALMISDTAQLGAEQSGPLNTQGELGLGRRSGQKLEGKAGAEQAAASTDPGHMSCHSPGHWMT